MEVLCWILAWLWLGAIILYCLAAITHHEGSLVTKIFVITLWPVALAWIWLVGRKNDY